MKKINLIASALMVSFLLLFTIGCQEGSSLVGPENTSVSDQNQLDKKGKKDKKDKDSDKYSVSQLITAKTGGKITLKVDYKGEYLGKKVKKAKITAEIKFAPGTIDVDTEFTMTFNPEDGMISFSPGMQFNNTAPLTISVKGVDLKKMKIDKKSLGFVYFDAVGNEVEVDSKKIWVKKDSFGILQVEIPHFSRYGFVK